MRTQKLLDILKTTFGYDDFRFDQLKIINSILDQHDTLAIMPTGGGKSLCYQIPALFSEGITLVISPLISLMHDQVAHLHEYDIKACFLNSSLSSNEWRESKDAILNGEVKLVYVSPEGVLSPSLAAFLGQVTVSLIAIDEAHCVSQWGHEFRKDYARLGELKTQFPDVPTIALTATADPKTRKDIAKQLGMKSHREFVSSFDRPNIKYMISERKDEMGQLEHFIQTHHPEDTGIVYCLSRKKVEEVADYLEEQGYPAVPYHAGLSQDIRSRNQERFNTDERIIVVATIAFGMGIDRPDVRFVAHLDLPKSIEGYYQETGRAGRDGNPSTAWMLYGYQDVAKLSRMIESGDATPAYKKTAQLKLDHMFSLCKTRSCRRHALLLYFGEEYSEDCANCDCCLGETAIAPAMHVRKERSLDRPSMSARNSTELFHELKQLRADLAKSKRIFPYMVFSDRSLHEMCEKMPLTREAFSEIYGVGQGKKLKTYAHAFLTVIKAHAKSPVVSRSRTRPSRDILDALKGLRLRIARENDVPAYIVFNDKTLHEISAVMPQTKDEFLAIHGVGEKKYKLFGKEFLSMVKAFLEKN